MNPSKDHRGAGPIPPSLRRELNRSRQEVARLRGAQRQFVADTIHDLRSPLAATIGAVGLLAEGQDLTEFQRRELLEMTRRSLERLRSAMDDLLATQDEPTAADRRQPSEPR